MANTKRTWQLISLILACALNAALIRLHQVTAAPRPAPGTLPTVNKMAGYEHLALSPNARRAFERYSL
ncbi:hypothetical protein [Pseudomonas sp. NY15354]|uniref:hypothetical protein n=1 Tax=Pseudomonas sp. NY15354 TaxID=3400351 RepID=UPI003A87AD91